MPNKAGDLKNRPLIKQHGRMWPRNETNIGKIPGHGEGGVGAYVLYDGSMPVYIGMGNIRQRITRHTRGRRLKGMWDHFSWYVPADPDHKREIEALLLHVLPFHLRVLCRKTGKIHGKFRAKLDPHPEPIDHLKLPPPSRPRTK